MLEKNLSNSENTRNSETIRVKVAGLGILKNLIPDPHLCLRESTSISGLVDQMMEKYGESFTSTILDQDTKQLHPFICVLLNGVIVSDLTEKLGEGDEVTLFIPVSGG